MTTTTTNKITHTHTKASLTKCLNTQYSRVRVQEFAEILIRRHGMYLSIETCHAMQPGCKHWKSLRHTNLVACMMNNYTVDEVYKVIIDRLREIDDVQERANAQSALEEAAPESATTETKVETKVETNVAPTIEHGAMLAELVRKIAGHAEQAVDETKVRAIADSVFADSRAKVLEEAYELLAKRSPLTVEIKRPNLPTINVGVQHRNFTLLLKTANCRLGNGRRMNVWLRGPASTGKTTAAANVAKAMDLKFYFTGAIETAYALMGYTDAHGRTIRTPFRDAWEHGGVFLMDEVDASSPQALCALNAAIDGSVAAFPDGMIERHADCVILAGANSVGQGGDSKYAGRVRQDVAFLSRWVLLEWPLDEVLEGHLAGNDVAGTNMLKIVRAMRSVAKDMRIEMPQLSTRAVLDGAAMLRGDLPLDFVLACACRKGLPQDSWSRVMTSPTVEQAIAEARA